jgi:trk system potassium uptake protein TrkH
MVCAVLAVVSLALEYGFDRPPLPIPLLIAVQIVAVAVYIASRVLVVMRTSNRWAAVRGHWLDALLLAAAALFLFARMELSHRPVLRLSTLYVGVMQVTLLVRLGIEAIRLNLAMSQSRLHPARLLALTFIVLIVLGTLALALPKSTSVELQERPGFTVPRHVLNCAFTAVSATCVTGLVVYDTGSDFTRLGQVVVLILIQAGGLGIMVFGSGLGVLVGQRLSLRQSLVLQDAISHRTLGRLRSMVVFILVSTFALEAVGTAMLYPMWHGIESRGERLFYSVFHAVSAFCNAGFALPSDSLITYRRSWAVYGCIAPLIVLGGLGFPVLHDLWLALRTVATRFVRRRAPNWRLLPVSGSLRRNGGTRHRPRFTLHTKIVLVTSGVLLAVGTIAFVVFESFGFLADSSAAPHTGATLANASGFGTWLDAFFYSVTCRTAGFNTVSMDAESMSPASHLLGGILMFIGGSPGSTAGGIKTIGLAVVTLDVWATLRGRHRVEAFHRTIPNAVVRRSMVVVVVMLALVGAAALTLCATEHVSLRVATFESVSAAGTVGLSTGLTPRLTMVGRVVIMVVMFAGRLGPLTVLIALAGQTQTATYQYPDESVTIG